MTGRIIKSLGGFYTVLADGRIFDCKPRGIFRKEKTVLVVGDKVECQEQEKDLGIINSLYERENHFERPPIANLDRMFIIVAAANPTPDTLFVDKLTVICKSRGVEPVIVINKCDLADASVIEQTYKKAGFTCLKVCAARREGIDKLMAEIKGHTCGFAGFSGVGKSSLISLIIDKALETGSVSLKLGRGKHTTRHVELFPLDGNTFIADTPGFSSLDVALNGIRKDDLPYLFPEFEPYIGSCKFTTCAHVKEKGCEILNAVEQGLIPKSRHQSYVHMYTELKNIHDWK